MKNTKRCTVWTAFAVVLSVLMLMPQSGWAQNGGSPDKEKMDPGVRYKVEIVPANVTVQVGGEVDFKAFLVDPQGAKKETQCVWSFAGRPVGILTQQGHFKALTEGKGLIVATAGKVSGKTQVTVQGDGAAQRGTHVVVTPKDTVLKAGDKVAFKAVLLDSSGKPLQAAFLWQVSDSHVGKIDANGNFTALAWGQASVIAVTQGRTGKANVMVLRDSLAWWRKHLRYAVVVTPKDTCVRIGATVQFAAVLLDSAGKPVSAQFSWSLEEEGFGSIDAGGLFTAAAKGQGFVFATTGEFTGKAHVAVEPDSGGCKPKRPAKRLVVLPKDTLVAVGGTVRYKAFFIDTAGVQTQAAVTWDLVSGKPIGSISSGGEFKALFAGVGTVRARTADKYTALACVRIGQTKPTAKTDSIKFNFRDKNNDRVGSIHSIADKDVLKIGGLPFPLNILNGGEVVFLPGSMGPNVSIDVTLPGLALLKGDTTVDFLKNVLTGIAFHVFVDGKEVSPYYFPTPVQVVLPYKPELMEKLGLTPENLWAFFSTPSGGFDSTGVSSVVVDTTENKIIISVVHFSDIVLANKNAATVTGVQTQNVLPGACRLYENYPNPFNPETRIRFDVANGPQKIRLSVYDILGREIRVLADRAFAPGSYDAVWNGKDGSGLAMGTGIYILRMESAEATLTQRMVLMK